MISAFTASGKRERENVYVLMPRLILHFVTFYEPSDFPNSIELESEIFTGFVC